MPFSRLALLVFVAGCNAVPDDDGLCSADLCTHNCANSGECPSGSYCQPTRADEDGALDNGVASDSVYVECALQTKKKKEESAEELVPQMCLLPPEPTVGDSRLHSGLGVPVMSSTLDGAYFSVDEAPEETSVVVCALFQCLPDIRRAARNQEEVSITNWDACVRRTEQFAAISVGFDAGVQPALEAVCNDGDILVDHFTVGCWAYSDTQLIAATRLRTIDPTLVQSLGDFVPGHDCDGNKGLSCYEPDISSFGTCVGGTCAQRCVQHRDCEFDECVVPDGQYVGTCHINAASQEKGPLLFDQDVQP